MASVESSPAASVRGEKVDEKNGEVAATAAPTDASGLGDGSVQRALKSRQIAMIAIGGCIGTGIFVGAGSALATGGPLGVLLGYIIMGINIYAMMVALGEMTTQFPVSGAFVHYASRFVDPALGVALGYNYYYSWAITIPTEISAAALVIEWWPGGQAVSPAVFITIFMIGILATNFFSVRVYGELEFWFSLMKVLAIVGLIILGIFITAGCTPSHEAIGFRFWHEQLFMQMNGIPGAKGQFLAFWTVFIQAAYSFLGTEIVALTAAEAKNPRRAIPTAIRNVFWRILLFYVVGVFVMSLIVSPNDPGLLGNDGTSASPWVIAIRNAGIPALPSIINAVVLISAFSAGMSDLYASSRTLYGLAVDHKAPAIFRRCLSNGLPIYAVGVTSLFGVLAYMTVTESAGQVFTWLANLGSITGLIAWATITFTFIRYHKACKIQGFDRNTLAFKAPLQPYLSYASCIMTCIVIFFNGYYLFLDASWSSADFVVDYIAVVIFFLTWAGWKIVKKTKLVPLELVDLDTGRREFDEMSERENDFVKKPSIGSKIWAAIV